MTSGFAFLGNLRNARAAASAIIITAWCYIRRAQLCHSTSYVCLSVRLWLSGVVNLWSHSLEYFENNFTFHISHFYDFCSGWPTGRPQHGQFAATGTPPKLGWNRVGTMCKKPAISLKRRTRTDWQDVAYVHLRKSHFTEPARKKVEWR